jgi:hypothetical protein
MTRPTRNRRLSRRWLLASALACALLAALAGGGSALAAAAPRWSLDSNSAPAYLVPGSEEAQVVVIATNLGDAKLDGSKTPITIKDTLPPGLKITNVAGHLARGRQAEGKGEMTCPPPGAHGPVTCTFGEALAPYESLEVAINVEVESPTEPLVNEVRASGGEGPGGTPAPSASVGVPLHVGASTPYGIEKFNVGVENESGLPASQAGEHPFR